MSTKNEISPSTSTHYLENKLNITDTLVRTTLNSINHEISELENRMKNIQFVKKDKGKMSQQIASSSSDINAEHIYETIPEIGDTEIEPIYACPYESGEEYTIEYWLKTQKSNWCSQTKETSKEIKTSDKPKSKSLKSNSSGEEHENSSSAYNTGESSNSNPLTLELAYTINSKDKDVYG